MLSREENDFYTRVGPGTPAGAFLRRYWHPVAVAGELTEERPTRFVRVLGEDLVLFRDRSGRVGLIADRCSHRGASMLYGRVEERGIACAYHGWLYDTEGRILETPPERNDAIMRGCRQTAYPVRRFIGLYWAYLGPEPRPQIPPYDVWVRRDGFRRIVVYPELLCNWLQPMENSCDPAHLQILHQEFVGRGRVPASTTRGFIDDVADTEFYPTPFGLMKRRTYRNGHVDEHPVMLPNMLREGNATQIRVPLDDTHTWHVHVEFYPGEPSRASLEDEDPDVEYIEPYRDPPEAPHPAARYDLRSVLAQDHMAWETQGAVADRTAEHLSYSDRGVSLLRRLLKENIERVARGEDPAGLIRDPDHPVIDTNLDAQIEEMRQNGRMRVRLAHIAARAQAAEGGRTAAAAAARQGR